MLLLNSWLVFALAAGPVALAAPVEVPALRWRWESAVPVVFQGESTTYTPRGTWYLSVENLEARAMEATVALTTTCQAVNKIRSSWEIHCALDAAAVSGIGYPGEEEPLRQIFAEYEALLAGARVEFLFSESGQIRSFELQGLPKGTERAATVEEMLVLSLRGIFGQLELRVPGPVALDDTWKQKGAPLLLSLRSTRGTAGGVVLKHRLTALTREEATILSEGRATLMPGSVVESDGTFMVAVDLAGESRFDIAAGMLSYREYVAIGNLTAETSAAEPDVYYREIGSLQRLPTP